MVPRLTALAALVVAVALLASPGPPAEVQAQARPIAANQVQGLLGTVQMVVTTNVDLTAVFTGTYDGISSVQGRKVLLVGQDSHGENGIYVHRAFDNKLGRPTDDGNLVAGAAIPYGSKVAVAGGNVHAGTIWELRGSTPWFTGGSGENNYDGFENHVVLVDTNNQFWRMEGTRTGAFADSFASDMPGAILMDGTSTIGKTGSGATYQGNYYRHLFDLLKTLPPNVGTEDFDSGNTVTVFDGRGRVVAGRDNMGGTAANRLTSGSKAAIAGTTLGASGGDEEHTLVAAEMPSHDHTFGGNRLTNTTAGGGAARITDLLNDGGGGHSAVTTSAGGDEAHNNVQPTFVANRFIQP